MNAIQKQVESLREALGQTQAVDEKARESLQSLQHEIEQLLERQGGSSLTDRLEKIAVRFEADHPAVGNALRQAIDALAKAGI